MGQQTNIDSGKVRRLRRWRDYRSAGYEEDPLQKDKPYTRPSIFFQIPAYIDPKKPRKKRRNR